MRALRVVLFVLVFLCLSAQLIRHVYVRWIEQQDSVLDKHKQTVHQEIRNATSLQDLEKRYAEEVKEARAEAAGSPKKNPCEYEPEDPADRSSEVVALRGAIEDWERKRNEIRELRFFWTCGLAAVALAVLCHRRGWHWAAMALLILGLVEMEWWTSPAFLGGAQHEFTRLLDNKILFTVLSLAVLLGCWLRGPLRPAASGSSFERAGRDAP